MNKRKRLFKLGVFSLLIASSVGCISVVASSNDNIKDKINNLTEQFNYKKSNLEKTGSYKSNTKESKEVKDLGIQIANLTESIETEAHYKKELEDSIYWCKKGLEDTKEEQKTDYCQYRQDFIDKMEKKLASIEAELNSNESHVNKTGEVDSNSENTSSKKLLEKLRDRSDVDN